MRRLFAAALGVIAIGVTMGRGSHKDGQLYTFSNATREYIPDCAEPCYRNAAHAAGCATQNQIECRCGSAEDQRVRMAAAHCFRAMCPPDEFQNAMRFADIVCVNKTSRPTEVGGDDQEELDDAVTEASPLTATDLPENTKGREPASGGPALPQPSTLVTLTTGSASSTSSASTSPTPHSSGSTGGGGYESDGNDGLTTGAQAGIAVGAVMSAAVLGMVGYLLFVRFRKARAAKAARVTNAPTSTATASSQPEMSELGGGGGLGAGEAGGGEGGWEPKPKVVAAEEPATELDAVHEPPQYHEMYVEPVELDSRPLETRP